MGNRSFFKAIILFAALFIVCSCGLRTKDSVPYFGPHSPHPSPFAQSKLILAESSFANGTQARTFRSATATYQDTESLTNPGLRIVAVVDNQCAKSFCKDSRVSHSLSCYLLASSDYKPNLPRQLYGFPLSKSMSMADLNLWAQEKCVVGISNEWTYRPTSFNDSYYSSHQKAYMDTIRFESAISKFNPSQLSPVKVAVIDTGVAKHPDLGESNEIPGVIYREDMRSTASKLTPGCQESKYTNETPLHYHGTFVAGLIGAKTNNAMGISGIAPNVQLQAFTVGNCEGMVRTAEVGNALLAALANEAEVVNLSLGGGYNDIAELYAITQLLNKKAVIVAAAGNEMKDLSLFPHFPASYAKDYKGVISVGWGTQDGDIAKGEDAIGGSNYSPSHVKILAPGSNIISLTLPETSTGGGLANGYYIASGSSASTPIVSAAAALTLGFLKANNLKYDEQMIEYLVTELGARHSNSLATYIKNGAILDLNILAEKLQFLVASGTNPSPISISNPSLTFNQSSNSPQLQFSASWDLGATHYGARIGLFDATCGTYTASCLIQNFPLSGNQGSQIFTLTRNEALPMIASISDPSFALIVNIAIYYPQIDPKTKAPVNTFGIDAKTVINLRDYDMSTSSSPLLGQVTNIRSDMQNLYVQGWTCLQGSNKALSVSLIDNLGNKIEAQFGYFYPLMWPHQTLDTIGSFAYYGGAFIADYISIPHPLKASHLSGLEGNPLLITDCRTLTASHGFEFVLPFKLIKDRNLTGKTFFVQVQNPNYSSKTLRISDKFGGGVFTIPEINYQPLVSSNVKVNRNTNAITVEGSVCSASPSPVHVEFSFTNWNLRCRLKQVTPFPTTDLCHLGVAAGPPPVFDPALSDRTFGSFYYYRFQSDADRGPVRTVLDMRLTAEDLEKSLRAFPVRWPNALVSLAPMATQNQAEFTSFLTSHDLREIVSGEPITGFVANSKQVVEQGPFPPSLFKLYQQDRVNNAMDPRGYSWDTYDIGEPFTDSVVGYSIDTSKPTGDYLFRNYLVKKVLREVKKFETPLGNQTQNLGHEIINIPSKVSAPCNFKFSFSHPIPDITTYTPQIDAYIRGLLKSNENPYNFIPIDDVTASMREVPINIRFFQDGVMILHLLSDYHDRTYPIPTLGRGGP